MGYREPNEWSDYWAFGWTHGTGYDMNGPFGDAMVIRQGAYVAKVNLGLYLNL